MHKGVISSSSGNHGIALSTICNELNVPCTIVVQGHCPGSNYTEHNKVLKTLSVFLNPTEYKRNKIRSSNAQLIECPSNELKDRYLYCEELAKRSGTLFIKTSDEPNVMEGQGTLALELHEQVRYPLDALVVPLGIGGMISGVCVATKAVSPHCRIIAVEPEGKGLASCIKSRKMTCPEGYLKTAAEGIKVSQCLQIVVNPTKFSA